jgi:hypothetical protein
VAVPRWSEFLPSLARIDGGPNPPLPEPTNKTLDPKLSNCEVISFCAPEPSEKISMIAVMPITIPRMVSSDLPLLLFKDFPPVCRICLILIASHYSKLNRWVIIYRYE